jgi:hypothetical protein
VSVLLGGAAVGDTARFIAAKRFKSPFWRVEFADRRPSFSNSWKVSSGIADFIPLEKECARCDATAIA